MSSLEEDGLQQQTSAPGVTLVIYEQESESTIHTDALRLPVDNKRLEKHRRV